jgi:hypothetical protein
MTGWLLRLTLRLRSWLQAAKTVPKICFPPASFPPVDRAGVMPFRRTAAILIGASLIPLAVAGRPSSSLAQDTFRVGFSSSVFTDVNENDARGAIKVWGEMVARERHIPVETVPLFFRDLATMEGSLRQGELDVLALNVIEYAHLLQQTHLAPIFLPRSAGGFAETYILLAHRRGPVTKTADLRGKHLRLYKNPRACLAPAWLDVVLVRNGSKPLARLAGTITADTKISNVVLPVFFRQVDACLVTRSGFELMTELNPQIGQELVVLAESEAVVPTVFAFKADFGSPYREDILSGVAELGTTVAGKQVLTIFHSESIKEHPASSLDSALKLLAEHQRLVP